MNQQDKDRLRELAGSASEWDAQSYRDYYAHATPSDILSLLEEIEALAKKAARYDWLRRGDNDEKVLIRYLSKPDALDGPTMYLPREVHLDAAIDAAMQPKGA